MFTYIQHFKWLNAVALTRAPVESNHFVNSDKCVLFLSKQYGYLVMVNRVSENLIKVSEFCH